MVQSNKTSIVDLFLHDFHQSLNVLIFYTQENIYNVYNYTMYIIFTRSALLFYHTIKLKITLLLSKIIVVLIC